MDRTFPTTRKFLHAALISCLGFFSGKDLRAEDRQVYFHAPSGKEVALIQQVLKDGDSLPDPEYMSQPFSIKKDMKLTYLRLDGNNGPELILSTENLNFCGATSCYITIWKNNNVKWTEIGYIEKDGDSIMVSSDKLNGFKKIRFPGEKFYYFFDPKFQEYECHHCPMEDDIQRELSIPIKPMDR